VLHPDCDHHHAVLLLQPASSTPSVSVFWFSFLCLRVKRANQQCVVLYPKWIAKKEGSGFGLEAAASHVLVVAAGTGKDGDVCYCHATTIE